MGYPLTSRKEREGGCILIPTPNQLIRGYHVIRPLYVKIPVAFLVDTVHCPPDFRLSHWLLLEKAIILLILEL